MSSAIIQFHDPHLHKRIEIEEEILVTERRLQDLRALRNVFLPISTLPEDVLCKIFLMTKSTYYAITDLTIHRLTWVSRHWRKVALDFANLWVDVTHSLSKTWFRIHLERSREANLSVVFGDSSYKPTLEMMNQLVSQFHRVSSLDFRSNHPEPSDHLDRILTIPAPGLRSLEVFMKVLPEIFFSEVAPLLEQVNIAYCSKFRFPAISRFSTITELKLAYLGSTISVSEVLTNTRCFSKLHTLWLSGVLKESAEDAIMELHGLDPVDLPALRLIVLGAPPISTAIHLLSHLPIHDEVEVRVTLPRRYEDTHDHLYSQLLSTLHVSMPTRQSQMIVTNDKLEMSSVLPGGIGTRIIRLPSKVPWESLIRIFDALPVERFQTLKVCTSDMAIMPAWKTLFMQFKHIQELEVLEVAAASFINHLGSCGEAQARSREVAIAAKAWFPFQLLRRLVIERIESEDLLAENIQLSFCAGLKSRRDDGVGLEELVGRKLPEGFRGDQLALCADVVRLEDERKEDFWMAYSNSL